MSKLVVLTGREYMKGNEKKIAWTRIGRAWKKENGSLSVQLDALPTNGSMLIKKDEPREQREQRPAGDDDDDIPF